MRATSTAYILYRAILRALLSTVENLSGHVGDDVCDSAEGEHLIYRFYIWRPVMELKYHKVRQSSSQKGVVMATSTIKAKLRYVTQNKSAFHTFEHQGHDAVPH